MQVREWFKIYRIIGLITYYISEFRTFVRIRCAVKLQISIDHYLKIEIGSSAKTATCIGLFTASKSSTILIFHYFSCTITKKCNVYLPVFTVNLLRVWSWLLSISISQFLPCFLFREFRFFSVWSFLFLVWTSPIGTFFFVVSKLHLSKLPI